MLLSNGGAGADCVLRSNTEISRLMSPPITMPDESQLTLSFDALTFDTGVACTDILGFDLKDLGVSTNGGATYDLLNAACGPVTNAGLPGQIQALEYDVSAWAGQTIQLVIVYHTCFDTGGPAGCIASNGHTFAIDNVVLSPPAEYNPGQEDSDGDGIGDACDDP